MGNGLGIAGSMRGITEDIMASYDMRVKALGDLVTGTRMTLKGFTSDRKKMGREQAKNLADFVEGLSKSVGNMLEEFGDNHSQMSKEQAKNLTNFARNLTENIKEMVRDIQKSHKEMSDNLKGNLEKGERDRLKDFKGMMGCIHKGIKDIENYVANKLREFSDAHAEMSEQQKKDLANYVRGIVNEVKNLLSEYGSDMEKARASWQDMASTLAKSRGNGGMPRIEARERVATVDEAIKKVRKNRKKNKI